MIINCFYLKLQDRLAEKENELTDVTNNMNSQIQQEKDKVKILFNLHVHLLVSKSFNSGQIL